MSFVKAILESEIERFVEMEQVYMEKVNSLPRGSVHCRVIKRNEYGYHRYKDGDHFVQKYLGVYSGDNVQELIQKIERRKNCESELRNLRKAKAEMERYLKYLNKR